VIGGAAPPIAPSPPGAGVAGVEAEGVAGADLIFSDIRSDMRNTHEADTEADSIGAEADSTGSDSVGVETVGSAGYSSVAVAEADGTTTSEDEAAGTEAEEAVTDAEGAAEDTDAEGAGAGAEPPPE
jgi:hypothetical protein